MGKCDEYIRQLQPMLGRTIERADLETFLVSHSNLPGPRGNLGLAFAIADCFGTLDVEQHHLEMLFTWIAISPDETGVNSPRLFLPFCAILSLGSCYHSAADRVKKEILDVLKASASDTR